jgi:transcriptional regulator with GAF, ATPase, and Fis domain
VKAGSFRADLLYRLNVFPIDVPPLSARASDIPLLVNRFVDKFSHKMGKKIDGVSQSTMERLMKYSWPGNIRELENVIERATILAKGSILQIDDVTLQGNSAPLLPIADSLEEVERAHILRILQETNWVIEGKQGAATRLGLHPTRSGHVCRSCASRNLIPPHSNQSNVPLPRNIVTPRYLVEASLFRSGSSCCK